MSRPVVLVDIGEAALPAVTPVVPVEASWVPEIYEAPPPPPPFALDAQSVSDGILLTWMHPGGVGIDFRIERAPDVAGVPGTWIQVGRTADLRYTSTTPADQVTGYWFRVRAVRNGKYSGYTDAEFQWPYASNPPVQQLTISFNTITVDCRYTRFALLLDSDVNYVSFINVPPGKVLVIYITQSGGDHGILFPNWVRPAAGVPYLVSTVNGVTDVVGLDTDNGGIDWTLIAQQPAGGGTAFVVTAWPSPAYAQVYCTPTTGAAPSIQINAEQINGSAPVTFDWSRIDAYGGADFLIDDDTSATPTFSVASGTTGLDVTQVWRVVVTDSVGRTVNTTVTVRLQRVQVADEDISEGLLNPGFELGNYGWDLGTSMAIVTAYPYTGAWSLQLNTGYTGTSEAINQYEADVVPGQVLTARCMVHQGASDVGRTGGYVRIKWYNAGGGWIGNADGNVVDDGRGGAIHPSVRTVTVPAGAAKARLAGVLFRTGQNYVCNADDFSWARLS